MPSEVVRTLPKPIDISFETTPDSEPPPRSSYRAPKRPEPRARLTLPDARITGVAPGSFPYPLTDGPQESRYLTWVRNHANYMGVGGLRDYFSAAAILVRGALLNALATMPWLLVAAAIVAGYHFLTKTDHGASTESSHFPVTAWVLRGAALSVLLFPFGSYLLRLTGHRKAQRTGTDSTVKKRSRWGLRYGGLLAVALLVLSAEALPASLEEFHFLVHDRAFSWPGFASLLGVGVAISTVSEKMLAMLPRAARYGVTALVAALGVLLPLLFVLLVADFLAFARPDPSWLEQVRDVYSVMCLGVLVALVVGVFTRAYSWKSALSALLLWVGLSTAGSHLYETHADSYKKRLQELDTQLANILVYELGGPGLAQDRDKLIEDAAKQLASPNDSQSTRLNELKRQASVIAAYEEDDDKAAAEAYAERRAEATESASAVEAHAEQRAGATESAPAVVGPDRVQSARELHRLELRTADPEEQLQHLGLLASVLGWEKGGQLAKTLWKKLSSPTSAAGSSVPQLTDKQRTSTMRTDNSEALSQEKKDLQALREEINDLWSMVEFAMLPKPVPDQPAGKQSPASSSELVRYVLSRGVSDRSPEENRPVRLLDFVTTKVKADQWPKWLEDESLSELSQEQELPDAPDWSAALEERFPQLTKDNRTSLLRDTLLEALAFEHRIYLAGIDLVAPAAFSPTRYKAIFSSELAKEALVPKLILVLVCAFVSWLFCWLTLDINLTSLHGLYRDRLAAAFLIGSDSRGDVDIEEDLDMGDLSRHEAGSTAPYHLINAALNLQGSKDMGVRDRRCDYFIFSKLFIGGERTGYCRGASMESVFPQMSLSTAMAISAAAASPNMGRATSPALAPIMTLLNVRLGIWIPNPGLLEQRLAPRERGDSRRGFSFSDVFEQELVQVERRRHQLAHAAKRHLAGTEMPTVEHGLFGIGFSGGGIRSATVNLGVAQALHRCGVFEHLDYMSTVSGGGYLGASISALMRRRSHTESEIAGRVQLRADDGGHKLVTITPEPLGRWAGAARMLRRTLRLGRSLPDAEPPAPRTYRFAGYAQLAVKDGARVAAGQRLLSMTPDPDALAGTPGELGKWRVRPSALFREMRGRLDEKQRLVNVSDGGHIENLACIELLRRRCKYIIIGDAEADPAHAFGGLAMLIRSARIDLGVHIEINVDALRLDPETRYSREHWAIGRITYPRDASHAEAEEGYLLYLKSSLTRDEDEVIREYRHRSSTFPHESTADQMFDDGQFEAYRSLGQHIGEQVASYLPKRAAARTPAFADIEEWFSILQGKQQQRSDREIDRRTQAQRVG